MKKDENGQKRTEEQKMFKITGDNELMILCPHCGCEYNYIIDVFNTLNKEEYANKNYKSGAIQITIECVDCGQINTFTIGEHKGNVFFNAGSNE